MKNSHRWREIMYGLNEDNIREVETGYARRYPKLARFADIPKQQNEVHGVA